MEDIDGGLHSAVDGQSLDEDEDEVLASDGCAAQFKSKLPFLLLSNTEVPGAEIAVVEKMGAFWFQT